MSEQANKWRIILEAANAISNNENINNGHIMYVDLLEERTVWHLHIELESMVSSDEIFDVMEKVANYFYSMSNINLVRFTWHYKNQEFSKEYVEEYLTKGIM